MSRTVVLLMLVLPPMLGAQERSTTAFVVTERGREIGKERITLESSAAGPANRVKVAANDLAGEELEAVLSRASTGRFDALQMERRGSAGTEIIRAGHSGNRIIVTSSGPTGRRTRELPAGDNIVLLDESLHGLLYLAAELATPAGQALTGLYVRSGRRVSFVATRRDAGSRGSKVDFRGDILALLLLDPDGRLERLDLPNEGITLNPLPR